jgi:hypothetical protein
MRTHGGTPGHAKGIEYTGHHEETGPLRSRLMQTNGSRCHMPHADGSPGGYAFVLTRIHGHAADGSAWRPDHSPRVCRQRSARALAA